MSREWSETLTRLDISPDPTAGQSRQLGDVERTIQTLTRPAEELHSTTQRGTGHVTRLEHAQETRQNQRQQSVPVDVCAPFTRVEHRGHGWHRSNHDGAKPDTQNGRSEHEFANACAPPNLESLIEAEGENTSNSNRVTLCASGEFRVEGQQSGPHWNGNWVGPARILNHHRRNDGELGPQPEFVSSLSTSDQRRHE